MNQTYTSGTLWHKSMFAFNLENPHPRSVNALDELACLRLQERQSIALDSIEFLKQMHISTLAQIYNVEHAWGV